MNARTDGPRVRFICDSGFSNIALLPTIYVGGGTERGLVYGWVFIVWLRGRIGFSRY
jgi:hypothetical protein